VVVCSSGVLGVSLEAIKAKLEALCKNVDYAVALFLKVFTGSEYIYWSNVKWYGVSEGIAQDVESSLKALMEEASKLDYEYRYEFHKTLKKVAGECIDRFSGELEKRVEERMKKLTEFERRILKHASHWLNLHKEAYTDDNKVFYTSSSNGDDLVDSLCAALSLDYSQAREVKRLLAYVGLAFYYSQPLGRTTYHHYMIPRYALMTIESLAREAEKELSGIVESLRRLDSKTFTAILIRLLGTTHELFEAVYGVDYHSFLTSLNIEGLCYGGYVNRSLRDVITRVAKEATEERCRKLYNSIKGVLAEKDYEIYTVTMPDIESFYCVFEAVKLGRYEVTIHVMPFPYIYYTRGVKTVVVFEGPIAKPGAFQELVVVGMDDGFAGVKTIVDNVGSEWSREIVEVFKSLQLARAVEVPTLAPPSRVEVTRGVYPPSRELLESIVAKVLKDLGFNVKTNARIPARGGGSLEVDVWAVKRAGDSTFRVYVSCKNWDRDVDRSVVDEEFGRVLNLQEVPHLRILVVKSMTGPAREAAEADGFYVVELGEKAVAGNEEEIYRLVYKKLSDIFTGIAPPQLQEIARRVGETAKELARIAEELAKLSQKT